MINLERRFVFFWLLVLPITSVLVIPFVQGTVPNTICSVLSVGIVLGAQRKRQSAYFRILLTLVVVTAALTICAEFVAYSFVKPGSLFNLTLIEATDRNTYLRSTTVTQLLYLTCCFLTFSFAVVFYDSSWNRWILAGGWFLVIYGTYEIVFHQLTGGYGDFLSNRIMEHDGVEASGSLTQTATIAGLTIMRMKSLTGEPSMFAFTMLPYMIFADSIRKTRTSTVFTLVLLLSTATTAIVAVVVYRALIFFRSFSGGKTRTSAVKQFIACSTGMILLLVLMYSGLLSSTYEKLNGTDDTGSGADRSDCAQRNFQFFEEGNVAVKFFGIGWGVVRSPDFISTLVVNTGIIGTVSFSCIFLLPTFRMRPTPENGELRLIGPLCLLVMLLSVPEFAYPSTWLFLGIVYNKLRKDLGDQPKVDYKTVIGRGFRQAAIYRGPLRRIGRRRYQNDFDFTTANAPHSK
jgi:hypothetical protein